MGIIKSDYYGTVKNQGYHMEPARKDPSKGPIETAEDYRADMIEAMTNERLRRERRKMV